MNQKVAFALYMRAVVDSKRNPDHLTPERLFAAFHTIHADVSFEDWEQKLNMISQVSAPENEDEARDAATAEMTDEQKSEANEIAIQAILKAQKEGQFPGTISVKPNVVENLPPPSKNITPISSAVQPQ
jgi:hypothetical protein